MEDNAKAITVTNAITVKDLTKGFGKKQVLNGVSMNIKKGSIYAFLGRNGEGKTTTLRLFLNLLTPDSGSIEIMGMNALKNSVEIRRIIGYVPETPVFYEWMKVSEILGFMRSCFPETWDLKKQGELVKKFALEPEDKFGSLSHGSKAKVLLTASLSHDAEIVILDDPTSGLDVAIRREFMESLADLAGDGETTIIFSSHIITELERIADQVGILSGGRIISECSLEDLKKSTRRIRFLTGDGFDESKLDFLKDCILKKEKGNKDMTITARNLDSFRIDRLREMAGAEIFDMDLEEIFIALTAEPEA